LLALALLAVLPMLSCASTRPDAHTFVMIIESSPSNLDPRVGTDAQSERIDKLLFDSLLRRDEHFNLEPALATSWEIPDPLTYVFHLRSSVRFHNGALLTARDVKWTFDSIMSGKLVSPKTGTYDKVASIETPDESTVIFHLKEPYSPLLWNLADGAIGIVPYGAGAEMKDHPIGSGPFRFVSQATDNFVVIERNPDYWGTPPRLERVRFAVIPDPTTRALELRKGSADAAANAFSADTVVALEHDRDLRVEITPGTIYAYLAFNLRDPILKDVRVRQAIAYALNREEIIHYLWRDQAQLAASILPPQSWAYDADVPGYSFDPARANQILDAAGYRRGPDGVRFHLTMKTSTEESTRLMAAVFQQQLRRAGIALDIRSFEFATFYSDVTKGAFQLHSLRWIGGNEDPDIFEAVFDSRSTPPRRYNRTYYSNPRVDELIAAGRRELDQSKRKAIYAELQRILATDLPYVNLWFYDNVLVTSGRVRNAHLDPPGSYDFLKSCELVQ
jgi:ABC-type transport system substrate-binding protein